MLICRRLVHGVWEDCEITDLKPGERYRLIHKGGRADEEPKHPWQVNGEVVPESGDWADQMIKQLGK